jgi:RNA polymerase sigma-70 factor (ECF subfamily)
VSQGRPDIPADVPPRDAARAGEAVRAALADAAPLVQRYLYGVCGNWDQAEDLAQSVLLKAWDKRAGFDGRANVRTWVFAIARNHWRDQLRRRRSAGVEQPMTEDMAIRDHSPSPLEHAARGEMAAVLQAAVALMPDEQREALSLRESEGLTFAQIAGLLGVPCATVKSRVRYALLKLADAHQRFRQELES